MLLDNQAMLKHLNKQYFSIKIKNKKKNKNMVKQ